VSGRRRLAAVAPPVRRATELCPFPIGAPGRQALRCQWPCGGDPNRPGKGIAGRNCPRLSAPFPLCTFLSTIFACGDIELLIDGRRPEPAGSAPYDIVIVGTGPAGITLALELERSGLKIAMLESGGDEFDPDTQALYDGVVSGNAGALDLAAIRLRLFGGTSGHWAGRCAPLDEIDFSRSPEGLSGWPFSRQHLFPFYERAQSYLQIGAFDYALDAATGLDAEDLFLTGSPDFETEMMRLSPPTRFGSTYGERLRASATIDVWLWTNVTHVGLGPDGAPGKIETRTQSGVSRSFQARAVVLACGAVENARLLLASNARDGTGYGNAGDLLGRCYMDHPAGDAARIAFSSPQPPKAYWTHPRTHGTDGVSFQFNLRPTDVALEREGLLNVHFYLIPLSPGAATRDRQRASERSITALKSIAKYSLGRDVGTGFSLSGAYCDFITNADQFLADRAISLVRGGMIDEAILEYEQEEPPLRSNAVTLSEERDALGQPRANVHWAQGEDQIQSIQRSAALLGVAAGAEGLGRVRLEDHDDAPYWGMISSWHQIGTTRMAVSPTSGVTDPTGRVHGTQALYIAGAGLFPTSGRSNPTLTIVALAIRLADHLRQKVPTL